MRNSIKKYAISVVGDIYPEEVIAKFRSTTKYQDKKEWLESIKSIININRYLDAIELSRSCPSINEQLRVWKINDITPKRMDNFRLLNLCLLQEIVKSTTDEQLLKYYRLRLGLNDGTAVSQRSRMAEMAHRAEGKLIVKFAENPEALPKAELRKFVIIAALLSDGDIYHDQSVLLDFLDLVDYIS